MFNESHPRWAEYQAIKADHQRARATMAFGIDADTRARAAADAKKLSDKAFELRMAVDA